MKKWLDTIFFGIICGCLILLVYNNQTTPKVIDGGKPWSNGFDNQFSINSTDVANIYVDYIDQWKKKVFNIDPIPDIIDTHEDPKKCICKGSGIIIQGDGHKTVCPFHGGNINKSILKPINISE
jgi:hypothetical protein